MVSELQLNCKRLNLSERRVSGLSPRLKRSKQNAITSDSCKPIVLGVAYKEPMKNMTSFALRQELTPSGLKLIIEGAISEKIVFPEIVPQKVSEVSIDLSH